eukprot:scaffold16934_cov80-Phaeocystis_antarctica.AAC.6
MCCGSCGASPRACSHSRGPALKSASLQISHGSGGVTRAPEGHRMRERARLGCVRGIVLKPTGPLV